MRERSPDPTDIAAGVLFLLFAFYFGLSSLGMELGTAFRMGPGYAPLVLAVVLAILGALIVLSGLRRRGVAAPAGALAWRGMALLLPAPILFGLTVRPVGFVPAIFLATLLAAFASPRMKPWQALALAAAITIFSTLVFSYGLGLPFRRFGPLLGG